MSLVMVVGDEALERTVRSALADGAESEVRPWGRPLVDGADVKRLANLAPGVVVLGPALGDDTAFDLAAEFDRHYPGIGVLMVTKPAPDTWQRAMASGVRGLIAQDASASEFRAQLVRAVEVTRQRREMTAPTAAPARARVITVVSPKGGSGKTIVSTNLAVGLALRHPGDVVLLDLDLQFGDVADALALWPHHTIADAVSVLDDLDATLVKVFLTGHESGLHVLCAPEEPAAGEVIPVAAAGKVMQLIASEFGYVVIDTPSAVGEHTRAALDFSTDVVLVCDMDVPAVRDLGKVVGLLGARSRRPYLVLNRADSRVGLAKSEVVEAVGAPIDVEIPSSAHVPISLNRGRPLILANPHSAVARRFAEVAAWFASDEPDRPGRGAGMRTLWSTWSDRLTGWREWASHMWTRD